ncbi:hypothetical protein NDR87_02200 [Nocardia sp. CDC159]|uniref:DNA-binding protein n=1 Tax=Nocardia pulmonis TaxID=2951408 RepID=A0A9X2ITV2_9NOCA|nr:MULTISPECIES: hypothetical protein [Nocardia]MCM6772177.1 hypothetical protein [Nocardia pulmonis]MCM6785165.1 hypothetical protein [Nocardia sp. CDC159]
MSEAGKWDLALVREWLNRPPGAGERVPEDPKEAVRAVVSRLAADEGVVPTPEVLGACALMLTAARAELDRLELALLRAAGERGVGWATIAETFGYRSKQAAHARASALYHRLEYGTGRAE